eukprot:7591833-Pyramimonas_sp.AAC.1
MRYQLSSSGHAVMCTDNSALTRYAQKTAMVCTSIARGGQNMIASDDNNDESSDTGNPDRRRRKVPPRETCITDIRISRHVCEL